MTSDSGPLRDPCAPALRAFLATAFLVSSPAQAAEYPLECLYAAKSGMGELQSHAGCAARAGSTIRIAKDHLERMSVSPHGLAAASVDGQWYYVKANGDVLAVLAYDNAPDDFSEGLTRSLVSGKIAYFDKHFRLVVGPTYDWGWPFENGRALVCLGCRAGEPDKTGHTPVVGGKWGYISRDGKEIVPVTLPRAGALAR